MLEEGSKMSSGEVSLPAEKDPNEELTAPASSGAMSDKPSSNEGTKDSQPTDALPGDMGRENLTTTDAHVIESSGSSSISITGSDSDLEPIILDTWSRIKNKLVDIDIDPLMSRLNKENCNYQTREKKWSPLMILSGLTSNTSTGTAVRRLIQLGANPALADERGWTALHFAAFYGSPQAARELLALAQDLSIATKTSSQKENAQEVLSMLQQLLKCTNRDGLTPIELAEQQKNETVVQVLKQAAELLQTELQTNKHDKTFEQVLLDAWDLQDFSNLMKRLNPMNCNFKTQQDWTPLMILAGLNATGTGPHQTDTVKGRPNNPIKQVLSMGANPYIKDGEGWNALHWASYHECPEAARELVQYRKLMEATDCQGRTALSIAKEERNRLVVQVIEEAMGCDLNQDIAASGQTTLPAAVVPFTPTDNLDAVAEAKNEIEDPPKRAYDFGKIENMATQDTLPLVASMSMSTHDVKDEHQDKVALLPNSNSNRVPNEDDSLSSGSTKNLNEKREAERRCGGFTFFLGFLGVITGVVVLVLGMKSSNQGSIASPAPSGSAISIAPTGTVTVSPTVVANSVAPAVGPLLFTPIPSKEHPAMGFTPPQPIAYQLPNVTIEAIALDPESPQAQAFQWLVGDPNLDTYSLDRLQQRYALAALYYATNGDNWILENVDNQAHALSNNFLGLSFSRFLSYSVHECEWLPRLTRNQTCNLKDEYLVIYLPGTHLSGTIPPEIGLMLPTLESLELTDNSILGSIPKTLGDLARLESLNLAMNKLSGLVPGEISRATSLRRLFLADNTELSAWIGHHENITEGESGVLRLGALANLQELTLDNTSIMGELPSSLCGLAVFEFTCSDKLCGCDCGCARTETSLPTEFPSDTTFPMAMDEKTEEPTENSFGETTRVPATTTEPSMSPSMFSLSPPASTGHRTSSPSTAPAGSTATSEILTFVPTVFADPNSPQARAMQWLRADPAFHEYQFFRKQQRLVLASLFYSTSMVSPWMNSSGWLSYELHECDWWADPNLLQKHQLSSPCQAAVEVEGPGPVDRLVVAILLPNNGLEGAIPNEFSLLHELRVIDMSGNRLTGPIPNLAGLSKLQELNLGHNSLQGTVPTVLGLLSTLSTLFLWANRLTGEVPSEIGQLKDLSSLALSINQLEQTIPKQLGMLVNLEHLWLNRNRLNGTLPVELTSCQPLKTLDVGFNQLTSSIPNQIGRLTKLETLSLRNNRFSGGFPIEICLIGASLRSLDLSRNVLKWSLPSEIWLNLTSIRHLDVAHNAFTGTLAGLGSISLPLNILDVSSNQLSGVPNKFGRLTALEMLNLSFNDLKGLLPSSIGRLTKLQELRLNHNLLRGSIPANLGNLRSLKHLYLHDTLLSGRVPSSLIQLSHLDTLTINGTLVSGRLPARLCQIGSLQFTCSSRFCGCAECGCPSLRYFG